MKHKPGILLLASFILSSCSDVLIEEHIEGTWELQSYLRNDVDETPEMKIEEYLETYQFDGTYTRSYIDGNQNPVQETGEFSINEENSSIHISDVSSISEFSEEHSTLSTSTIDVLILDETEYAYSFENGGDKHEFRFFKKQ